MEFGRLTPEEITTVDFTIPPDAAGNAKVLTGKPKNGKVYFGMPKWGRTEWVGPLYPNKTKEKDFISHYVNHFNSVELNATHYRLWGSAGIAKWADKAREKDFKFCPKMYQGITHRGALKGKEFLTSEFIKGIEAFGEHLGPCLVQVSDTFSAKRKAELFKFLEAFPLNIQFFLETRHASLVSDPELYSFLSLNNIGSVITDSAGRRDVLHMNLTIPKTMIRFVGTGQSIDQARIDHWAERLKVWLAQGIEEIYFFLHPFDEREDLKLAQYCIEQFNKVAGAKLAPLLLND